MQKFISAVCACAYVFLYHIRQFDFCEFAEIKLAEYVPILLSLIKIRNLHPHKLHAISYKPALDFFLAQYFLSLNIYIS